MRTFSLGYTVILLVEDVVQAGGDFTIPIQQRLAFMPSVSVSYITVNHRWTG